MSPPSSEPLTLLVVDDDPSLLSLVATVLGRRGYRVLAADSSAAALRQWAAEEPAIRLLLTDVVMPGGISGVELAARLLADRPDLRVLFMTGHAKGADLESFVATRGAGLILKPFTLDALLQSVRAQLA
jgi:two-component system cell cycle sensor histidine kinase/response regulator CckA